MKIVLAIVGFLLLFGCNGTTGPVGPAGRDGRDGNANVSTVIFTISKSEWTSNGNVYSYFRQINSITQNVLDFGLVLVYEKVYNGNTESWYLWNETTEHDFTYHYFWEYVSYASLGYLDLQIIDSNTLNPRLPDVAAGTIKVIIIPNTYSMIPLVKANKSDYNSVQSILNLKN